MSSSNGLKFKLPIHSTNISRGFGTFKQLQITPHHSWYHPPSPQGTSAFTGKRPKTNRASNLRCSRVITPASAESDNETPWWKLKSARKTENASETGEAQYTNIKTLLFDFLLFLFVIIITFFFFFLWQQRLSFVLQRSLRNAAAKQWSGGTIMLGNLQMEKDGEGRFFCKPVHYQVQASLELEINLHRKSAKAGWREASVMREPYLASPMSFHEEGSIQDDQMTWQ